MENHQIRRARARVVALTTLAALGTWMIAEPVLGVALMSPSSGGRAARDVNGWDVGVAAFVASLVGWAALAVLERFTRRAKQVWIGVALAVAAMSLGGPLSGVGVSSANRAWLVVLHVVVAATLIALLARTARRPSPSRPSPDKPEFALTEAGRR